MMATTGRAKRKSRAKPDLTFEGNRILRATIVKKTLDAYFAYARPTFGDEKEAKMEELSIAARNWISNDMKKAKVFDADYAATIAARLFNRLNDMVDNTVKEWDTIKLEKKWLETTETITFDKAIESGKNEMSIRKVVDAHREICRSVWATQDLSAHQRIALAMALKSTITLATLEQAEEAFSILTKAANALDWAGPFNNGYVIVADGRMDTFHSWGWAKRDKALMTVVALEAVGADPCDAVVIASIKEWFKNLEEVRKERTRQIGTYISPAAVAQLLNIPYKDILAKIEQKEIPVAYHRPYRSQWRGIKFIPLIDPLVIRAMMVGADSHVS